MSLEKCRECKHEVSVNARNCPNCGAPYPAKQEWIGTGFEWKSSVEYMGFPLIHIAFGRTAQNKLRVAKGIIAIGQFAFGLITVAQFGVGLLFGFGQFIVGFAAVAQFAITLYLGLGQFTVGHIAIGQIAFGHFVLAQAGYGQYIWSTNIHDPIAMQYFNETFGRFGLHLGDAWMNKLPK